MPRCVSNPTHTGALIILKLPAQNNQNRPKNSQVDFAAKSRARYLLSPRTAYISPTYRLQDLALWPILILPAPLQAGSARPRIPNGCRTESPCGTENRSPKKTGNTPQDCGEKTKYSTPASPPHDCSRARSPRPLLPGIRRCGIPSGEGAFPAIL